MNRTSSWFVVVLAAGVGGCDKRIQDTPSNAVGTASSSTAHQSPSHDPMQMSRDQLAAIEGVTKVLERITDDASAAAALSDLEKAVDRLAAANKKMADLQQASQDQDMTAAMARFNEPEVQKQMERVIDAAAGMMGAQLEAQLKAPKYQARIRTITERANIRPKSKPPKGGKR